MSLLPFVWKWQGGSWDSKSSNSNRALLEASPPTAPPGGPAPSPGTPGPGAWAPTGRPDPDLWESSRAEPEAPLSCQGDRPFPRRPAPAPPRAPDGTRGPSRPPPGADSAARPTPGPGAPRGDQLTGATLAHTPGRPLLPAAPRSPARSSSRWARRVQPGPPVTAPSPGGSPGGRTEREDVARTEVASGKAGSVLERPGRGQGPARLPGLRARTLPASIPGSEVPARPRPARRGGPNFQPHFARPPSSLHHMEIYSLRK
ncbi:basic proline-rich protein-like [Zalophus californianus]|uniref:Basic proline-rich protein-like n=1 Tax=Zalophus californianus TaxID=9704 RepID=A0A6J2C2N8_ZALCA|nr:basic proline-rich protein-like [Zalophus californianus]